MMMDPLRAPLSLAPILLPMFLVIETQHGLQEAGLEHVLLV